MTRILSTFSFRGPTAGWNWTNAVASATVQTAYGTRVEPRPGQTVTIEGPGVHTRSGDSIELEFAVPAGPVGSLSLGFAGGMETLRAELYLASRRLALYTSEWTRRQPVAITKLAAVRPGRHRLRIDKAEGPGRLVKTADASVFFDGRQVLAAEQLDVLPEMGVAVTVSNGPVTLKRLVHRGVPSGVPEYLHVGGYQVLNRPNIQANLESIFRGLRQAAERGVRLLVTPETSLTGLFPRRAVTRRDGPVAEAEQAIRRYIRRLKNAPYLVTGLPVWKSVPGQNGRKARYNVSRVYDPEGREVLGGAKIHSCEHDFCHGRQLMEFDVDGVPTCMLICHDGRYPDVWTLPIMFGARLVIHPSNGGTITGSVDAFETGASRQTSTMHAFYLRVNGGGGSCLVGPAKYDNILAVSDECRRDNAAFPSVGPPVECLIHARIRVHDAFGYWPMRSFRVSESAAKAYVQLYRSLGGARSVADSVLRCPRRQG